MKTLTITLRDYEFEYLQAGLMALIMKCRQHAAKHDKEIITTANDVLMRLNLAWNDEAQDQ